MSCCSEKASLNKQMMKKFRDKLLLEVPERYRLAGSGINHLQLNSDVITLKSKCGKRRTKYPPSVSNSREILLQSDRASLNMNEATSLLSRYKRPNEQELPRLHTLWQTKGVKIPKHVGMSPAMLSQGAQFKETATCTQTKPEWCF